MDVDAIRSGLEAYRNGLELDSYELDRGLRLTSQEDPRTADQAVVTLDMEPTDGSAARKFDAMMEKRPYAKRVTFVIDPTGVLRHIDESVDVTKHGSDLVGVIRGLQQG